MAYLTKNGTVPVERLKGKKLNVPDDIQREVERMTAAVRREMAVRASAAHGERCEEAGGRGGLGFSCAAFAARHSPLGIHRSAFTARPLPLGLCCSAFAARPPLPLDLCRSASSASVPLTHRPAPTLAAHPPRLPPPPPARSLAGEAPHDGDPLPAAAAGRDAGRAGAGDAARGDGGAPPPRGQGQPPGSLPTSAVGGRWRAEKDARCNNKKVPPVEGLRVGYLARKI